MADQRGGAYIRLLDRGTRARAFLRLHSDDHAYLDLLQWSADSIRIRRLGAAKDTVFSQAR